MCAIPSIFMPPDFVTKEARIDDHIRLRHHVPASAYDLATEPKTRRWLWLHTLAERAL